MDKLVLFLLVSLVLITILLLVSEFKKEKFKDLDLNESDKAVRLYDVFNFLGKVGLPLELQTAYMATLRAEDPSQQPELDDFLNKIKNDTLVVSPENLDYIEEVLNIKLSTKGLISSLNTLRANVHAMKIFNAYDDFNYMKLAPNTFD